MGNRSRRAMESVMRGSVTNSEYASSTTTRHVAGTRSTNAASSSVPTIVPVGLFGLAISTIFVSAVTASASASRSNVWRRSGGLICSASTRPANCGYASNEGQQKATRSPRSRYDSASCCSRPTDPAPTVTRSGVTPSESASAARSSVARWSGYPDTPSTASRIAAATDGSGPYGNSFDASLMASAMPCSSIAAAADRPGR